MKSNEDYLDELLKSMSEENAETSPLARFGLEPEPKTEMPSMDNGMGMMDQAMIDALLAGAAGENSSEELVIEEEPQGLDAAEEFAEPQLFDSPEEFEKALMAELEEENSNNIDNIENFDSIENFEGIESIENFDNIESLDGIENFDNIDNLDDIESFENIENFENTDSFDNLKEPEESEASSMLAQLMAEMQEETQESDFSSFDDDDLMTEESIEALLSAAKNSSADMYEEQPISFDMSDADEMSEIEALLGASDMNEISEESSALLRMLEEAEAQAPIQLDENEILEVDEAELDAILSMGSSGQVSDTKLEEDSTDNKKKSKKEKVKKEKVKKEKAEKEKKAFNFKEFFGKIFSALMEEIPEEDPDGEKGIKLSEENKMILDELDQEGDKKIKVFGKKEKKEKVEKPKKEKKPKKDKKPKNKKKPKKEKKPKAPKIAENTAPERKIPRKKIIVTFIFGFSVLALILLLEFFAAPMLTQSRARSAYDKGDYYEAYKEYYGLKLSEEDEKRFQSATTILRMQSNLDAYNNYMKMNKEVKALHSLLEGVRVKFDVYMKAEELGVLSQVTSVYQQILEILESKYHLSEEEATSIVEEASDAVYTRKLEAVVEGKTYIDESSNQMNQNDMLPEEEVLFQN